MDVWDPGEEMTILRQIKKLIAGLYRGLKTSRYLDYPGNLVFMVKDWFLNICEVYGSKISNWAWHKRWNKKNRRRYKHG